MCACAGHTGCSHCAHSQGRIVWTCHVCGHAMCVDAQCVCALRASRATTQRKAPTHTSPNTRRCAAARSQFTLVWKRRAHAGQAGRRRSARPRRVFPRGRGDVVVLPAGVGAAPPSRATYPAPRHQARQHLAESQQAGAAARGQKDERRGRV
eukprot:49741-Chlamydomonas_euryale.AAC.1